MAKIHHRLAGRGEILPGELIDPPARLHDDAGLAHLHDVLEGVVVFAAGHLRQFVNRPRLAAGQFPQHLPAGGMADGGE